MVFPAVSLNFPLKVAPICTRTTALPCDIVGLAVFTATSLLTVPIHMLENPGMFCV